jgi:hypothetical protein
MERNWVHSSSRRTSGHEATSSETGSAEHDCEAGALEDTKRLLAQKLKKKQTDPEGGLAIELNSPRSKTHYSRLIPPVGSCRPRGQESPRA